MIGAASAPQRRRVLLAVPEPERERTLLDGLQADLSIEVIGRSWDLRSLRRDVAALAPDLILLSSSLRGAAGMAIEEIRGRAHVLVVSDSPNARAIEGLDVIALSGDKPIAEQVQIALAREESEPVNQDLPGSALVSPTEPCRLVGIFGAHGGVGRTFVALNLAATLAGQGRRTTLLDLDEHGASMTAALALEPTRNLFALREVVRRRGEFPSEYFERELHRTDGHLNILAGVPRRELATDISITFLEGVLDHARRNAEWVVLDTGDRWGSDGTGWNRFLAGWVTDSLWVVRGDLVGVWRAQTTLDTAKRYFQAPLQIVLNAAHDKIRAADVEAALGAQVVAVVPYNRRAAMRALEEQVPAISPGSVGLRRAFTDLICKLDPASANGQRRGLLRLPFAGRHASVKR